MTAELAKLGSVSKPTNFDYSVNDGNGLSYVQDAVAGTYYSYQYDNNGNLTNYKLEIGEGNGNVTGSTSQLWNQENRLRQVVAADGVVSAHTYSGDGLQQSLAVTPSGGSPTTTDFIWDGMNVLH